MKLPDKELTTYPALKAFIEGEGITVLEVSTRTTQLYGKANHSTQTIYIYPLAFKDKVAYQTLLHEYIHLFLGHKFGHGRLFKQLMQSYGFKQKNRFACK